MKGYARAQEKKGGGGYWSLNKNLFHSSLNMNRMSQ